MGADAGAVGVLAAGAVGFDVAGRVGASAEADGERGGERRREPLVSSSEVELQAASAKVSALRTTE